MSKKKQPHGALTPYGPNPPGRLQLPDGLCKGAREVQDEDTRDDVHHHMPSLGLGDRFAALGAKGGLKCKTAWEPD